jgi:hypothetical protein
MHARGVSSIDALSASNRRGGMGPSPGRLSQHEHLDDDPVRLSGDDWRRT